MKKLLLLLLLLAASLLFVSCPHPESPVIPEPEPEPEPVFVPPLNITTLRQFEHFVQGVWKSTSDESKYIVIAPEFYIDPDGSTMHGLGTTFHWYWWSDYEENPITSIDPEILFKGEDWITFDPYKVRFFGKPAEGYPFREYGDGYCYYLQGCKINGWWYKVSDDWNYDPDAASGGNSGSGSGSGTGTGGGSGGSLTDYIGSYSFTTASGSQTNGSITVSDGSWSYVSSKAGSSFTAETAESDGSSITLYFSMPYAGTLSEKFNVTMNGSSASWHCTESNGYAALQSVIFSSLFGVIGTDMTFEYSE